MLLGENFELRERVEGLEGEARRAEGERGELKERVRVLLEELASSDRLIEGLRQHEHQLEHALSDLEQKNADL